MFLRKCHVIHCKSILKNEFYYPRQKQLRTYCRHLYAWPFKYLNNVYVKWPFIYVFKVKFFQKNSETIIVISNFCFVYAYFPISFCIDYVLKWYLPNNQQQFLWVLSMQLYIAVTIFNLFWEFWVGNDWSFTMNIVFSQPSWIWFCM